MDRIGASVARQVASLRDPEDAAASIVELVLGSIELVGGDPVNEVLFSAEGRWLVTALEFGAEPVVDAVHGTCDHSSSAGRRTAGSTRTSTCARRRDGSTRSPT